MARPALTLSSLSRVALVGAALAVTGCSGPGVASAPPAVVDTAAVAAGVRATLDAQVEAWNAGSVRGFMEGYARADSLTFLSGGTVRQGWEEALYGYLRSYPDRETMGTLAFSDLTVRALGPDRALVWGRWRLQRASDAPGGLFTLVLAETPDGWRVVHDHTSSE